MHLWKKKLAKDDIEDNSEKYEEFKKLQKWRGSKDWWLDSQISTKLKKNSEERNQVT